VYDEEKEGYPSYKRNTQSYERRRQQRHANGAIYENVSTNSSERHQRTVGQVDVHDVDVDIQNQDAVYANLLPQQRQQQEQHHRHTVERSYTQPRESRTSAFKPEDEDITAMFDNVLKVAHEEDKSRSVLNLRQQMSSSSRVSHTSTPDLNMNVSGSRQGGHLHSYQSQPQQPQAPPPRAVVQPLMHHKQPVMEPDTGTFKSASSGSSSILSIEDVPHDISAMSVDDVGSCLCLLNMDQHVTDFQRCQIDGHLLTDMRENVLQGEFRFTPFNASKLMRFVRGWRPKVS
jgi:hypothetical protein